MTARTRAALVMVALVGVLGAGMVAVAEHRPPPHAGSTLVSAAGVAHNGEVSGERPTISGAPATTVATGAAATGAIPTVPAGNPIGGPAPAPTGAGPRSVSPTATPSSTTVVPSQQSSWAIDANGVSIRVRIEPASPRVGDTVRFFIDTATTMGEFCCETSLYVDGALVKVPSPATVGCPPPASTDEVATWVAPNRSFLNFMVEAGRMPACGNPLAIVTARLTGSAAVTP